MGNNKDSISAGVEAPAVAGDPATAMAPVLDYLFEARGLDFSGYHPDMLGRRIGKRLAATGCRDYADYVSRLHQNENELDRLVNVLTINVSQFFRDPLAYELLCERILPALIRNKAGQGDASLRIWSAGCAKGEEPYSVAILLRELMAREACGLKSHLFATDIDACALDAAREGRYAEAEVEQVKHGLLAKYFTAEGSVFRVVPGIRESVNFSFYDMLDKKHRTPPESVFGGFDLVLCRNLLIYFRPEYQIQIFQKLHDAITPEGYLVLGDAETIPMTLRHLFRREFEFSPIYRKL